MLCPFTWVFFDVHFTVHESDKFGSEFRRRVVSCLLAVLQNQTMGSEEHFVSSRGFFCCC